MVYSDEFMLKQLSKLTLEEIDVAKEEYKKLHPNDRKRMALFAIARNRKIEDERQNDFMRVLTKIKSAPSSATNTEQGNETR